jgi:signal transduction histidine kinase
VDLRAVVREVLALYGGQEGPVGFYGDIPDDLPAVCARAAEVKEVLVNLLENARDAVKDGGSVRIEAGTGASGHVAVHVVDDGQGIPLELLPQVFEPRFSTRSTGAGLGLSIVRRLVESWGGTLNLQSTRGAGTRVSLYLKTWGEEEPKGGGHAVEDPSS